MINQTRVTVHELKLFITQKCIVKADGATIYDAEDLDLVMPKYNLIEYCSNYSDTIGSSWYYFKDEATNFNADIANNRTFKSLEYKTKLFDNTVVDGDNSILKNSVITIPLKYLSNFQRSLEIPLIKCKVELNVTLTKHCVLPSACVKYNSVDFNNAIFSIKHTKFYVPVVTLLAKGNQKLSKRLSNEFERSVY